MPLFFRSVLAIFTVFNYKWVAASLLLFAMTVGGGLSAHAEVFYWQDEGTKMSLSFPDTWRMVHNQKTDDVLTIAAPSEAAFPVCRMRVREDLRNVIFPRFLADNVQHIDYSTAFWQSYADEFHTHRLDATHDNVGLGRGFGSMAYISYVPSVGPKMNRRALALASLYRDKLYVFECSSEAAAFGEWAPRFRRIANMIDFRKEVFELPNGRYRYFPADKILPIHNADGKVVYY